MILELPVRGDIPSYEFQIELEAVLYTLAFRWNERMEAWIMDIGNESAEKLLCGIPLYTNVDITSRFNIPGLPPGKFLVYDGSASELQPTRDNFGLAVKLLYQESNG